MPVQRPRGLRAGEKQFVKWAAEGAGNGQLSICNAWLASVAGGMVVPIRARETVKQGGTADLIRP